jgi:ferredoxin
MCETYAPKVFVLNDDRQSTVADPNADTFENIMEAAQDCPVSAITVIDDETGESLFP